jgi:signal transduction histidine kinase/DNA-binding response OmpR family regulator/ligand-binding sensor domain-containing protein
MVRNASYKYICAEPVAKKPLLKNPFTYLLIFASSSALAPLVLAPPALGQFHPVKVYTTNDGLVSNTVWQLMQDSRGFLWIGTSNGVSVYDGYTFTNYNEKNGLLYPFITGLAEDKSGAVWIATTAGGMYEWKDGAIAKRYALGSTAGDNQVMSLAVDTSGAVWFTTRNGVYTIRDDVVLLVRAQPLMAPGASEIAFDRRGRLWQATANRESIKVEIQPQEPSLTRSQVLRGSTVEEYSVTRVDSRGTLWLVRGDGQMLQLADTGIVRSVKTGIRGLRDFTDDGRGAFYFFNGDSIFRASLESLGNPKALPLQSQTGSQPGDVKCAIVDRENNLWVGTFSQGLVKLSDRNVSLLPREEKFKQQFSAEAMSDHNDHIWMTGQGGVFELFQDAAGVWRRHFHRLWNNSDHDFRPWCLIDREGKFWFKFSKRVLANYECSLLRVDVGHALNRKSTMRVMDTWLRGKDFPAGTNPVIWVDKNNHLWICQQHVGVLVYELSSRRLLKRFDIADGMTTDDIRTIAEDSLGNIWAGTWNDGIYIFSTDDSPRIIGRHTIQTGLAHNSVRAIVRGSDNSMWVGTRWGGISVFRSGKFTTISTQNGLEANNGYGFAEDTLGRMWTLLGAGAGVQAIDAKTFRVFPMLPALARGRPEASFGLLSSNIVWHCNFDGILLYDFSTDTAKKVPPPIHIRSVQVNGKLFRAESPSEFASESNIMISYSSPVFKDEKLVRFKYRLLGANAEWSAPTPDRAILFAALTPRDYRFEVIADNGYGAESEKPASYSFTILPPWYRTWWAYSLYGALAFAGLFTYRRYDLKQITLKNESKIAQAESRKLKEVDEMKSRFFANISHEFRTPLTLILGPIEKWRGRTGEGEMGSDLGMMHRNAQRLLRLINQLLDLSKLDAGKMALQLEEFDIAELVREVASSFDSLSTAKGIEYTVNAEPQSIIGMFDRDKVERILTNLLSNAFKFTQQGGAVAVALQSARSVDASSSRMGEEGRGRKGEHDSPSRPLSPSPIRLNEETVRITVQDTGIGIAANKLDKIFDRFYQVNDESTRDYEGTGIGLALTKEFVEHHGGTIAVESDVGKGTSFVVTLPLRRNSLLDGEVVGTFDIKDRMGEGAKGRAGEISSVPSDDSSLPPVSHSLTLPLSPSVTDGGQLHKEPAPLVLIIEDNADMRSYIRSVLGAEYAIHEAADGEAGVAKAKEEISDLIICDVMMPKMDGFQVCKALKQDEKTSHIPIIMLTAKAAMENKLEGLQLGADEYLAKPFEPKELLARANNLIELRRKLREKFSVSQPLKPGEIAVTSLDDAFLQKIKVVVEQRMEDENFSVEELASEVAMSRMQLHRKLTALTNQSASEFIRYLRLHRAKQMLEHDGGNVSEVAYSVGFGSPAHFAKCFKDQFGVAPSEVRSKL